MLRTSRTFLTILIFANACSPAILEEITNSTTALTHPKNMSDDVRTAAKSLATSVHRQEETTETTERSSNATVISSESKRKKKKDKTNCHLANEKEDMLKCFFVTDNVVTTQLTANVSHKITDEAEQTASRSNDTLPPNIFPQDEDVKSIDNADEATRRRLNHMLYTIITPKKVTDAFSIGVESKDDGKDTPTAPISPASKINNIRDTSFGNCSGIASQKAANDGGMSGGMIVLTAMLTFSIATAIVYAGVIAYKRYLEYRWNRRQLLDNDSEFDANDLHHFEL